MFGGSAGRALLFLQRFEAWGQASDLATALEYIEGALASVGAVSASTCGFLWGRPGVGAVGAVVRSRAGDEAGAQSLVDALVGYFEKAPDDSECPYDDWDSGRAGLLYVSKFLDEMLPQWPGGLPVIDRDLLAPVALAIIDRGTRLSDSPGEYLEWLSPNDQGKWLGMSHGSAGVLHGLLLVPEVVLGNSTARRLILGTIDHIVAQQQPSGSVPAWPPRGGSCRGLTRGDAVGSIPPGFLRRVLGPGGARGRRPFEAQSLRRDARARPQAWGSRPLGESRKQRRHHPHDAV